MGWLMDKWQDPRPPVSVTWVSGCKVTIFDQEAYEQSKIDYPDDPNVVVGAKTPLKPIPLKQKPAARWKWTQKLDRPLAG
jgi:hypothetical protein